MLLCSQSYHLHNMMPLLSLCCAQARVAAVEAFLRRSGERRCDLPRIRSAQEATKHRGLRRAFGQWNVRSVPGAWSEKHRKTYDFWGFAMFFQLNFPSEKVGNQFWFFGKADTSLTGIRMIHGVLFLTSPSD